MGNAATRRTGKEGTIDGVRAAVFGVRICASGIVILRGDHAARASARIQERCRADAGRAIAMPNRVNSNDRLRAVDSKHLAERVGVQSGPGKPVAEHCYGPATCRGSPLRYE